MAFDWIRKALSDDKGRKRIEDQQEKDKEARKKGKQDDFWTKHSISHTNFE